MAIPLGSSALVVLTSWDVKAHGTTRQPTRSIIKYLKKKTLQSYKLTRLYCTLLNDQISEEQQKDAETHGVTLIPAKRNQWLEAHEDPPGVNWLVNHAIYYPQLKSLQNIQHVVGFSTATKNAAAAIKQNLFNNALLHQETIPALPVEVLMVLKTWETKVESVTAKPTRTHMKEFIEALEIHEDPEIYCTLLDVEVTEEQINDAESVGVTLIPATRNKWLDKKPDLPGENWLIYHDIYYPQLKQLQNVQHVVGYASGGKNVAGAIHDGLFPEACLHQLDLPEPPPGALFVNDKWDLNDCGLTGFHRTLIQDFCARKRIDDKMAIKIYSTVADVTISDQQRVDAENCGVTLIPAVRKERAEPETDRPRLDWLFYHEIYFPDLCKLENIKHVIGYAPKSALAAADIKESVFSDAELVLINHAYEDRNCLWEVGKKKLSEKMLEMAGEADVIFSIGPKMHQHFVNEYRATFAGRELSTIPHEELFPMPRRSFFDKDPVLQDDISSHHILTYGQIETKEALKRCVTLATSLSSTANKIQGVHPSQPTWKIQGVSSRPDKTEIKHLKHKMKTCKIEATFDPSYTAKALQTSLHQSHLCLPASCYREYGFCGLEAMATGIPTCAFDDSELGRLVSKHLPMHADSCVARNGHEGLSDKIISVIKDTKLAFRKAKELKKAIRENKDVEKSYAKFASLLTPKKRKSADGKNGSASINGRECDTTMPVHVELDDSEYQQQLQNNTDDARQHDLETVWSSCRRSLKKRAGEAINNRDTAQKVRRTCVDEFGDGVETTGMGTESLQVSVAVPRLLNLYRLRGSCQSRRLSRSLDPILITDEMRENAASVGLPLKLIATYDQARFDELELFFINRDGGGVQPANIREDDIQEEEWGEAQLENIDLTSPEAPGIHDAESGKADVSLKSEDRLIRHGYPILSLKEETHSIGLQARSLLPYGTGPKELKGCKICRYYLELAETKSQALQRQVLGLEQDLATEVKEVSKVHAELLEKGKKDSAEMFKLQTEKKFLENKLTDIQQEKLVLEKRYNEQLLEVQNAEKVAATKLTEIRSLKEKLETFDPNNVERKIKELQSMLEQKDKAMNEFQTKFSKLSDDLSGQELQKLIAEILNIGKGSTAKEDIWSSRTLNGQSGDPGQMFKDVRGLTFHNDKLVVCDWGNNTVEVLNRNYTREKVIGSFSGQFAKPFKPMSIAISQDSFYFVLDDNNLQIVVIDQDIKIVGTIPLPRSSKPCCIALVKRFVLVTDDKSHCVLKYDRNGQYLAKVGGKGNGQRQFYNPFSVAVNSREVIMVSGCRSHCIKCFDLEFNYLYAYGQRGREDGQLWYANSIAIDGDDNVYVCDGGNARVVKWKSDGEWICNLFQGEVRYPEYMAVTATGDRIAVRGHPTNEIRVFSK
ncbi:uncharacterized protein [Ptychodera flava]|uniref:uncharacterized protein n=1 Tax=Ptychodera flava TaxID=63121 RepID=UPI00396AA4E0